MQSRDPYRSALFDSLPPLTSTFSINGDDETTSIRNSTVGKLMIKLIIIINSSWDSIVEM